MKKYIQITVCLGTTCHLMGSSHLQNLARDLPPVLSKHCEVVYKRCLGMCNDKNPGDSPYVIINKEVISDANLHRIIDRITLIIDQHDEQEGQNK
jgi:NADH:ubiquinone oxidoreductase subunit E